MRQLVERLLASTSENQGIACLPVAIDFFGATSHDIVRESEEVSQRSKIWVTPNNNKFECMSVDSTKLRTYYGRVVF